MIDINSIFKIKDKTEFNAIALEIFQFQFQHNRVYRSFCDLLYKHPSDVKLIEDIPFLPIDFFKTRKIICKDTPIETVFTSSGTTGNMTSKHYVTDLDVYKNSFRKGFSHFYGAIEDYAILALLPSYLEREGSSLVYMVNDLIAQSNSSDSGFYLNNLLELTETLHRLNSEGKKTLLIGVSFALLDLVEQQSFQLKNTVVMETGGMKGRRRELIRTELHQILKNGFGVNQIHSEYGMTELLSQAYSKGNGIFNCPPWMKVFTRDTEDPLSLQGKGKTGGINIIDLANIHSCSFIATQDLGKVYPDDSFEIIGRFDNADVRGCNLMVL
ncbi:Acyl-protein synthetase, LuxE [Hyunsoonleella jejuensis]|uniref:Acyl-protein synthetase, LuxE n=1 Tax=Hyunsoonleella jejuensis TaxID=419940 RepID=A0A1H9C341_9FLAO|nr:acyl transferase [Hyunsoonleella jejuensis]SEP95579.1 Acyl-protein synthetase, LuxE [Hyunsoonleella jejuensis]